MNRRLAVLLWAATLVVPVAFGGVAETARWGSGHLPESALFLGLSAGISALCVWLAFLLPGRIRPVPAGPEATAFVRLVSGLALCEGAAFLPLIAWILTDDPRLLAVCGADLLVLVILYPSPRRWDRLLPRPPPGRR